MTGCLFAIEGAAVETVIREYLSLSDALACELAQATVFNRRDTGRSLCMDLGVGVDGPKVVKPARSMNRQQTLVKGVSTSGLPR